MISGDYYEYLGSNLVLPFNKEKVNSIAWKLNGTTIYTDTVSDNGNSNQKYFTQLEVQLHKSMMKHT